MIKKLSNTIRLPQFSAAWKCLIGFLAITVTLPYEIRLPSGWQLNEKSASSITTKVATSDEIKFKVKDEKGEILFKVPSAGQYQISSEAKVYICESKPLGRCAMKRVRSERQVQISNEPLSLEGLIFSVPMPAS